MTQVQHRETSDFNVPTEFLSVNLLLAKSLGLTLQATLNYLSAHLISYQMLGSWSGAGSSD